MTDLIRNAKSGNDWTENDLRAYRIRVVYQDAATFFQIPGPDLPAPVVQHPAVLTLPDSATATESPVYQFLRTMDLAMLPVEVGESAVDDFAVLLLEELGYVSFGRVTRTRKSIPLVIFGENRHAKTDVCIDDSGILILLVQEDKRLGGNPVPQLVAEAIAAFQSNNVTREQTFGLPRLPSKVVPGITMKGTSPTFFKVLVTQELATAVMGGVYPTTETIVQAHLPTIPRPLDRLNEGMKPLDNRLLIMACFEAFKQFVR
ncbi:hypothetical protein B0H13DRAFT_1134084 [Mycena leptocephala]|nr:hypothetical protein B0H13DRAFT_1134084 [Mycena leptocephala]